MPPQKQHLTVMLLDSKHLEQNFFALELCIAWSHWWEGSSCKRDRAAGAAAILSCGKKQQTNNCCEAYTCSSLARFIFQKKWATSSLMLCETWKMTSILFKSLNSGEVLPSYAIYSHCSVLETLHGTDPSVIKFAASCGLSFAGSVRWNHGAFPENIWLHGLQSKKYLNSDEGHWLA